MKMLSKDNYASYYCYLRSAQDSLKICLGKMKGKYGTRRAVAHMEFCLSYIDDLISDDMWVKSFYQKFRNPPNTPKSRRLGWHKNGERNEQK